MVTAETGEVLVGKGLGCASGEGCLEAPFHHPNSQSLSGGREGQRAPQAV